MCDICANVGPNMDKDDATDMMGAIGRAIKAGQPAEHFKAALDILLSTEIEDRNPVAEQAWEDDYRGTD